MPFFKSVSNQQQHQHQQQQQHQHQQHQQQQLGGHHYNHQLQSKSPKTHKKVDSGNKCKRVLDTKRSMTDLLRTHNQATTSIPTTLPAALTALTSISSNGQQQQQQQPQPQLQLQSQPQSQQQQHGSQFKDVTAKSLKPPTKVKSGSWKRSEKQISTYNAAIAGKKAKTLRKRSPTWLKFSNSPMKIAEKSNANEATSVCRPGTLYSDVLFGAGSSCLVKIKTLTPRRTAAANSAQKKLTKALLKCTGSTEDAASGGGSEPETDRGLFPSLNEFNKSGSLTPPPTAACIMATVPASIGSDTSCGFMQDDNLCRMKASGSAAPSAVAADEESADVVILSESISTGRTSTPCSTGHNGYGTELSYGSYLDQHFQHADNDVQNASAEKATKRQPFIDIPQWNFVDVSTDTYPKFLCQFDDEHYMNTEQMALLGLKLALGNNSQQANKFRF